MKLTRALRHDRANSEIGEHQLKSNGCMPLNQNVIPKKITRNTKIREIYEKNTKYTKIYKIYNIRKKIKNKNGVKFVQSYRYGHKRNVLEFSAMSARLKLLICLMF